MYVAPARIARHAKIMTILLRHRTSIGVPVRVDESILPIIELFPVELRQRLAYQRRDGG